jgi:YD repeat-containing protein
LRYRTIALPVANWVAWCADRGAFASYNGLLAAEATKAGPWGFGRTGSYDASLAVSGEAATVHQDNGSVVVFYKSGSEYTQVGWDEARLVKEGTNYIYTLPNRTKLEFNSSGQLTKETERRGNSNTFTYNVSNQLEKITDGAGRTLTFKYNGEGLVESVNRPDETCRQLYVFVGKSHKRDDRRQSALEIRIRISASTEENNRRPRTLAHDHLRQFTSGEDSIAGWARTQMDVRQHARHGNHTVRTEYVGNPREKTCLPRSKNRIPS